MRSPEFWRGDNLPARLLTPLGHAYGLAGRLRRRLARPARADVPVICVGNLTVGGAGKTPVALALARHLTPKGCRPHLLTRGYGGRARGPLRVDPARHGVATVGDEALLLAQVAPTWCARDRVAGARAATAAGAGLLIMDDGFQNPWLHQDLALLVVDGASGFGNRRLLPAGPLREPLDAGLGRAGAVIRLGPDEAGIECLVPRHIPYLCGDLVAAPHAPVLRDRAVLAFAGIGRPQKFFSSLAGQGARLVATHAFADHHRYRRAEIEALLAEAKARDALCATTEKDRMRLPQDLLALITIAPVTVNWHDPAALDHLLEPLRATSRNDHLHLKDSLNYPNLNYS